MPIGRYEAAHESNLRLANDSSPMTTNIALEPQRLAVLGQRVPALLFA
jgi:hypothetical protein